MARANYVTLYDGPKVLLIKDVGPWDRYPTITNDAEAVVEELLPVLRGRRLEYVDSDGSRDRLVVEGGRFSRFLPGGECPNIEDRKIGLVATCDVHDCPFCEGSR